MITPTQNHGNSSGSLNPPMKTPDTDELQESKSGTNMPVFLYLGPKGLVNP